MDQTACIKAAYATNKLNKWVFIKMRCRNTLEIKIRELNLKNVMHTPNIG